MTQKTFFPVKLAFVSISLWNVRWVRGSRIVLLCLTNLLQSQECTSGKERTHSLSLSSKPHIHALPYGTHTNTHVCTWREVDPLISRCKRGSREKQFLCWNLCTQKGRQPSLNLCVANCHIAGGKEAPSQILRQHRCSMSKPRKSTALTWLISACLSLMERKSPVSTECINELVQIARQRKSYRKSIKVDGDWIGEK